MNDFLSGVIICCQKWPFAKVLHVSFLLCFLSGSSLILTVKESLHFSLETTETTSRLHKVMIISVWPLDLRRNGSRIKEQKYTSNA